MSLGGIIAGALSGGSKGVSEVGAFGMEKEAKIDYARQLTEMQAEKEKMLEQFRSDIRNSDADKAIDRDVAAAPRRAVAAAEGLRAAAPITNQTNRLLKEGEVDTQIALAPKVGEAAAATARAGQEAKDIEAAGNARRARDTTKADASDPAHLEALAKLAKAKDPIGLLNAQSQATQAGASALNAQTQAAIAKITLENQKRVDALRTEFGKATPERKLEIKQELEVLTGKDNDSFMPVPLKDEMGNITGYKIFDKKGGMWVEPKAAGTPGGADPSDPLGLRQKKDSPTKTGETTKTTPTPKAETGQPNSDQPTYEGWMRAKQKVEEVKAAAAKMSPDRRETYLSSRLPALEWELERQSKYAKY